MPCAKYGPLGRSSNAPPVLFVVSKALLEGLRPPASAMEEAWLEQRVAAGTDPFEVRAKARVKHLADRKARMRARREAKWREDFAYDMVRMKMRPVV